MHIHIQGAREHNLQGVDAEIGEGLTVVTGVSGSGKTSLVFDTLYHESRRRFLDIYSLGSASHSGNARLAPANVESITGLGPAVAVGQNLLNRNPASTLATAAGLHPFLRLLYAHFGERACPRCGASLSVYSEDEMVERLAEMAKSGPVNISALLLRGVKGGHRTLLKALAERFGAERVRVDGVLGTTGALSAAPTWKGKQLDAAKPHDVELVLADLAKVTSPRKLRSLVQQAADLGTPAIIVRRGSKDVQTWSRAPVCVVCGTWFGELSPVQFHQPCPHCEGQGCRECGGTGLPPQAAAVKWLGLSFRESLALSVDQALPLFANAQASAVTSRLRQEITRRLEALQRVGLGYVALDRPSPTLSRGEAQRVRLALTLISRLEDMLHVLDEPTIGQHPADVQRLLPALRDLAGPVVFVEHDRVAAAGADQAIDLGPGAGRQGGQVVFSGIPTQLWNADTATGRYFSLRERVQPPKPRPAPTQFLTIRDAHLRNLQEIDVAFPLGRLTVVTGVSGSGKSTLVEDVLVASLTSGKPEGCRAIDLAPHAGRGAKFKPVLVDQSPIGRNPRSNPATYTKLADTIRDLFATVTGRSPSHFSFNRPEGACPTCSGLGAVEVAMRYLPSTWIPCADCDGQRFTEEVLAARVPFGQQLFSIADFYDHSIAEVKEFFDAETRLPAAGRSAAQRILAALCDIGLGYLSLGQPSLTLSGGEAQRVKLARYLGQRSLAKELLVLDEPSTGLHPQDLAGLLTILDRLVRAGATIVVVEHNTDVIRAADWVVDLGPGAGPKGGRLLYAGPPARLTLVPESFTGQALRNEASLPPKPLARRKKSSQGNTISIRDARMHNLQGVDVDIPKGALTVVTGVSGSGKSSLVSDVIEAEARRRFLETLSLYERQGTREGPEAEVGSITGLGVALTIGAERLVYSRRATVGTATEIAHHLAALLATLGERKCLTCGATMRRGTQWECAACGTTAPLARPRHFSSSTYAAACLTCHGVGTRQVPNPHKLIIHPDRPLTDGAMYSPGFFPNGYLGKPFNGGYYQVLALGQRYGFDPHETPWNEMTPEAQQAFLFGTDEELTVTFHSRTGRANTRRQKFPGFYGFIRDWDVGGTYTDTQPCPACGGARLRPEYLVVTLSGRNIHQLSTLTLQELAQVIDNVETPQRDPVVPNAVALRVNAATSLRTIRERLHFLMDVGLGYLQLDRVAGTLSAGEAQHIRLASLLGSGLTSLTLLLDEPTRGLHPVEVDALIRALTELRGEGGNANTVIVIEHDPLVMRAADHLIDCGPGAGQFGGKIVAQGTPEEVARADTLTARWLRGPLGRKLEPPSRRAPTGWMTIRGARANNLKGEPVALPLGTLVGVCGVSGSGKSTLMMDTLGRALAPKKQTTSVAYVPTDPGEHDAIEGAPSRVVLVDQSRAGVHSPVAFLDLTPTLQAMFAASEEAQALGIDEAQLAARCSVCGGSGVITLDMAFLPEVHVPCETCRGAGLLPEAWEVRLRGVALPEVYGLTIDQVYELFSDEMQLARPLQAARDVGLGYLVLRQPGHALSGGEAQRLKIASEMMRTNSSDTLYLLDEPSGGQHLEDVQRLVGVLKRLVDQGGTVFVVEHHPHMLAACDWLVELGPVGGPEGGYIIASGTPEALAAGHTPTAPYLREVL